MQVSYVFTDVTRDIAQPGRWLTTHKTLAAGLGISALGIFVQAITGAKGYPRVPPGIPILALAALMVYHTARWTWTAVLGLILVGLIWIGVFATPGTADRLIHPGDIGPFLGTLVQLAGMTLALVAGLMTTVARVRLGHKKVVQ